MKVEIKEDKIIVKRNKKGGIKLRVVRGSLSSINCHGDCDLYYPYKNSLCSGFFHLCDYLRDNGLVYGDFLFKLEGKERSKNV